MNFKELVYGCRTFRRFDESVKISQAELIELVDYARTASCGGNIQALKYHISFKEAEMEAVFKTIKWAGYLKEWNGPTPGERPTGYIVVFCDRALGRNKQTDAGIAAQTIMLGARTMGYGGCMIGSCNRRQLAEIMKLDTERYEIALLLALGKPVEEVHVVEMPEDGSIQYYRDENQVHYVPKRSLEDVLV